MPLVKLYISKALTKPIPPLSVLQQHMCRIWGTQPSTTKLMMFKCDDWTNESFNEDVYVDIRAYGKSERTREFVLDGLNAIQKAFMDHDLMANIRLETYEGDRYFHLPPPTKK